MPHVVEVNVQKLVRDIRKRAPHNRPRSVSKKQPPDAIVQNILRWSLEQDKWSATLICVLAGMVLGREIERGAMSEIDALILIRDAADR